MVYQTLRKKEQKHDLVCLNLHTTKPQNEKEGWSREEMDRIITRLQLPTHHAFLIKTQMESMKPQIYCFVGKRKRIAPSWKHSHSFAFSEE